ncbi:putative membrane protein [Rhodococcus sp. 27YEA15]|uniref:SdpI family protein n=1 Tax=Rhodococcus sp. 27YEA15 TaxID=3156259 RepID=UPI003C7A2830
MEAGELTALSLCLSAGTVMLVAVGFFMPRFIGDQPSAVIGIRTAATMATPQAWQVAHRVAAPYLRRTGYVGTFGLALHLVVALVVGFGSISSVVTAVVAFTVVTAMLVDASLRGDRAARPWG